MRRVLAVLLAMVLTMGVFVIPTQAATLTLRVVVDNNELSFPDAKPFIDSNYRTQTPARFIGEALGATVSWDKDLQQAKFVKGGQELLINIGSEIYQLNGRDLKMDTQAIIVNNRTFVPARYVAEAFGASVSWDKDVWTVYIKSDEQETVTTGTGGIEYYDGVAFDPVADVDIYGMMVQEKATELEIAYSKYFRFIVEDGVYYIEGEYPELPDGFTLFVSFRIMRKGTFPKSYYSGDQGDPNYHFPTEGYFKKEVIEQDISQHNGYDLVLEIYDKDYQSEGNLIISTGHHYDDYKNLAEYVEDGGNYTEDYTDKIDFDSIFQWE